MSHKYSGRDYLCYVNDGAARPGTWRNMMFRIVAAHTNVDDADTALVKELSSPYSKPISGLKSAKVGIDWKWLAENLYIRFKS
jgi:hypothetical protein